MSAPLVSVVIPTYARPERLQACLAALDAQTFRGPWEIVVVDDGSPEPIQNDRDHASQSATHYPLIRVVRQENAGPAAARNHGVAVASAHVIAFTDDDCQPEATWLEQLFQRWQLNPRAMIGGTTHNGLPENPYSSSSQLIVDLVYRYFNANPDRAYYLASNNILCSRQQFLDLGGFDVSFPRAGAEDRDFCDRWRQQSWPLIWETGAHITHFHHQNFKRYLDLHARYGRGAFLYHQKRKLRHSGSMSDDLGFHGTLVRLLYERWRIDKGNRKWPLIWMNLAMWQLANAYGFLMESWRAAWISLESLVFKKSHPRRSL